jgi:hypothetical protein
MATPKKNAAPKKVATQPESAGARYRRLLRERTAASGKFARRDETYTQYNESTGKKIGKVGPKRGDYIDLYDDVSSVYGAIKKYGHEGYGGGDFPMDTAKANTYKGKQYLKYPSGASLTSGLKVKYGTIAGPKTMINPDALKAQKIKDAKRDAKIMTKRRGKGR